MVQVPPPPVWRWAYRFLGLRLPEPHRAWAAHEVSEADAVRRLALWRAVPLLLFQVLLLLVFVSTGHADTGIGAVLGVSMALLAGTQFRVDRTRRQTLRWQRVDAQGRPVEPTGFARLSNGAAALLSVGLMVATLLLARWALLAVG